MGTVTRLFLACQPATGLRHSARFLLAAIAIASQAWSSMWRNRTLSSCCDIHVLRLGEHLVAEIAAQESLGVQVDVSAQQLGEFILHGEESEPGRVSWGPSGLRSSASSADKVSFRFSDLFNPQRSQMNADYQF